MADAVKEHDIFKRKLQSQESTTSNHPVSESVVEYENKKNPLLNLNYNFTLIPPLARMITQGINYAGKSESFFKRFSSPKFDFVGDILFLDNETFIVRTRNKKDERLAIISMSKYGSQCRIKLVDGFGGDGVKKIKVDGETIFYTKGDANHDIDNYKITEDMIIGTVNVKIPYIGYPTVWLNEL